MSIAVLHELYHEVRRLSIAGSVVAPGDFRLQKLVEPLRKAGEKAPVFQRLADSAEQIIHSTEMTAAAALLELASLLTSILYTQGTTGIDGPIADLPPSPIKMQQTQTSARILKPLMDALTTHGSGRLEQIATAYALGLFNDLRLVHPALRAIDDSFNEIRDFIADKVLPLYGRAILPELQKSFDVKGKAGHARRLRLMYRLAPEETRDLILKSLEEGSKEVKVTAIECLGDSEEDLNYLIEQTKAKAKDVRGAALLSLSRLQHADAEQRLEQALDSKDIELLVQVAYDTFPAKLLSAALLRVESELAHLKTLVKKTDQTISVKRLLILIRIATAKMDKPVEQLLIQLLEQSDQIAEIKSDPGGADLMELAIQRLAADGSTKAIDYLIKHREQIPTEYWSDILRAARRHLKPAKFFDTFSPYVDTTHKRRSEEKMRSDAVCEQLAAAEYFSRIAFASAPEPSQLMPLDPRWLELAIKRDLVEIVCSMAKVNHPDLEDYLTAKFAHYNATRRIDLMMLVAQAMVQTNHPDQVDAVVGQIETARMDNAHWHNAHRWGRIASGLPKSVIPRLEAIVADPKTGPVWTDTLVETIQSLASRNEEQ